MKHITTILLTVLLLSGCVYYRPWTKTEKAILTASWVATGADCYTSERMLDDPDNYEALNLIAGRHPTDTELVTCIVTSQIAITVLAHVCPKWRSWLLGGKTALNAGCAAHNWDLIKD